MVHLADSRLEMIELKRSSLTASSYGGCGSCFWLIPTCSPIVCTLLWSLNVLIVFGVLRFFLSRWLPKRESAAPISTRSTPRTSRDASTTEETATLITPIPLTPFYIATTLV